MASYTRSVSTRWSYVEVKIKRAAGPGSEERRRHDKGLARDMRRRQTVQIRYRGGPECWWEITAPGTSMRFPGHLCLHDALKWFCEGRYAAPE